MDDAYFFSPNCRIYKFLIPLDFLKLLHVSKRFRRAAVALLKQMEADPETRVHANRFKAWLTTNPMTARGNRMLHQQMADPSNGALAGPLRLDAIQRLSSSLVNRFVVLEYKKTCYQEEHCKVAIFNGQGEFVAYYELRSV